MYGVKNVKTFHGHDGGCWEATLYCDGKRIAICTEDGWGGELQFHWLNHRKWDNADRQALNAFVLTLPKWGSRFSDDGKDDMDMTAAIHVGDLVNAFLTAKDLRKMLKKVTVFSKGELRVYNAPPTLLDDGFRTTIKGHFPDGIILNDIDFDKAMEFYKKAA